MLVSDYVASRELLWRLTLRQIRGQYKGSVLGWLWSMINPLSTVAVFAVVFAYFFRADPPVGDPSGVRNYVLYLVSGLIPWNLFAVGVSTSAGSLLGNSNLIAKVYFPRGVLVMASLFAVAFSSLIEFAVLIVVFLAAGSMVLPWLPVVLLLFVLELALILGIGLVVGVLNVYFRDVQYLVGIFLQIAFYLTPIIYPVSLVASRGDQVLFLYRLNPMVRLVQSYHAVLYDLRFPSLGDLAYVAGAAAVLLAVGVAVFTRLEGRLAEEL